MPHYLLHGLRVASPLELPARAHHGDGLDVQITLGDVPTTLAGARAVGVCVEALEDEVLVRVPDIARYWIRRGAEIRIDPASGADRDSVRWLLLGTPLGTLLHQRGTLCLHGSAVVIDGQAVAVLGASAAGKSTLAAALARRGHAILADELCAVAAGGSGPQLHAGRTRLKLWADVLPALDLDATHWPVVRPGLQAHGVALPRAGEATYPLRRAILLDHHNGSSVERSDVRGATRIKELVASTVARASLLGSRRPHAHFERCAALAADVPMTRLLRPRDLSTLDALVDRVLDAARP